jgi:hypothetical protein
MHACSSHVPGVPSLLCHSVAQLNMLLTSPLCCLCLQDGRHAVRCSSSRSTLVLSVAAVRGRARTCTLSTPCTKYSCGGTPLVPNNLQFATCCGEVVAVRRSCARAHGGEASASLPCCV